MRRNTLTYELHNLTITSLKLKRAIFQSLNINRVIDKLLVTLILQILDLIYFSMACIKLRLIEHIQLVSALHETLYNDHCVIMLLAPVVVVCVVLWSYHVVFCYAIRCVTLHCVQLWLWYLFFAL